MARTLMRMVGVVALLGALGPTAAAQAATPHIDSVMAALHQRNPGTQGKVWWMSNGNSLPAGWLLQTPDCWGSASCPHDPPPMGPPPGGAAILARLTQMISGAQRSVDFSGLFPPPDGAYRKAIIDGLIAAVARGYLPSVRILVGTPPFQFGSARRYRDQLVSDLKQRGVSVPVQVALMATYRQVLPPVPTSWDHSKVIAVDGRSAIVGGMNYWSKDYLQTADPANDVSMTVDGPAAADAGRFENLVWSWVCAHRHHPLYVTLATHDVRGCISHAAVLAAHPAGTVPILTLGRLGNGIPVPGGPPRSSPPIPTPPLRGSACNIFQRQVSDTNNNRAYEYRNPGETGLRALIRSAKRSIFLSQQDLLSCVYHVEALFDERVFAALAAKVAHHVPITIVLSDDGAKAAGAGYTNGKPIKQVAHTLTDVVSHAQRISFRRAREMVCRDVALGGIHSAHRRTWPNGSPFANHSKVVSVDNQAFYIGSENLYPARLQELGMIVEDPSASATLKASYLDPLWRFSRPYALIDPQHRVCGAF